MRKVWNALVRPLKNFRYQKKALKQIEKMDSGEIFVPPPLHEKQKKYYDEIQKDENIRKDLSTKHEELVKNMYEFNITSSELKEHYHTERPLPTWESEREHRNDPDWKFGFYEPPVEKIPKGKMLFREAIEILHARQELSGDPNIPRTQISESKKLLEEHPAVKRVEEEHLDRMWQFFRPFEIHDTQKVVSLSELEQLEEMLLTNKDEVDILGDIASGFEKLLPKSSSVRENYEKLNEQEKSELFKATLHIRTEETKRLKERLKEIGPPTLASEEIEDIEREKNKN